MRTPFVVYLKLKFFGLNYSSVVKSFKSSFAAFTILIEKSLPRSKLSLSIPLVLPRCSHCSVRSTFSVPLSVNLGSLG